MSWREQFECLWTFQHIRDKKVIFEFRDKKNILVDEGEEAMLRVFFLKQDSKYFTSDLFYIGLYKGTIVEGSTLATIFPNEPELKYGYSRLPIERSPVGFPTVEKAIDGNWRIISKEVIYTAVGGDIGPINSSFLCTSLNNTGVLIGAVSVGVNRTIKAGDQSVISIKFKQK